MISPNLFRTKHWKNDVTKIGRAALERTLPFPHSQLFRQSEAVPTVLISTIFEFGCIKYIIVPVLVRFGGISGIFGLVMGILARLHLAKIRTMARPKRGLICCRSVTKMVDEV